ncbi:MAG: hypothetical protein C5B46_09095 [Proteobacteria bacterium]|nr:MAG: hypothetical protein C5B46_09095 [Pseudomonadota bacterium]
MRKFPLTMIVAALMLAGCAANPVVQLNAPGLSVKPQKDGIPDPHPGQPMTLSEARAFALYVRATYREEQRSQVEQSQMLNSGLLLLGASVIGLAAGGANTNIILGTSLSGGTLYALGTINLDKRRLLVLSAGIKALDCADAAVLPLDVGTARRESLVVATRKVRDAIATVRDDRAALQAELDKIKNPSKPEELAAQAALVNTDRALEEASKSLRAAESLSSAIDDAGKRLQQTVLEITQKVDAAMLDTLVDISAIPQLVASLGGFASAFAPGAGIDKFIATGLSKYAVDSAKAAAPGLGEKMAILKASTEELRRQVDQLIDSMAGVDSSKVVKALQDCDVIGVAFPLTVTPAALEFTVKVAASKGFVIAGGTKPYTVRALDAFPEALSIAFDGGFADAAQIKLSAADATAGSYQVVIGDSSNPKRTQQVTVQLKAGATQSSAASQASTLDDLGKALTDLTVKSQDVTLKVAKATPSSDKTKLELNVSCAPATPTTKLKADDVRKALLNSEKVKPLSDQLKEKKLLDDTYSQIVFKPQNPNCFN